MFKKLSISQITLYILLVVSVVVACLFYFGGYVDPSAEYLEPTYTNELIVLMYVLVAIGVVAALICTVIGFSIKVKNEPKQAVKSLVMIGLVAVIMIVSYALSSGESVSTLGDGKSLSETWFKLVDMELYSIYVLLGISILVTLVGSFAKKLK